MVERIIQDTIKAEFATLKEELVELIQKQSSPQRYLTRKEVAAYLVIGLSTVDLWSRLGKLTKYRIDGSVRFDREEIDNVLKSQGHGR